MESGETLPIGIDLGTSYSCIGVYRNGKVDIIMNEKGDRTTPSIVSFIDNKTYVGEETEYKRLKDPKNKIYAIKRLIGRNYDDDEIKEDLKTLSYDIIKDKENRPKIKINGIKEPLSPEEISAKILSKLKQSAESFLGQKIKKVVITVPAYFQNNHKTATRNAGKIAGLDVIDIINEPTAAALALGFGKSQNIPAKLLGKNIVFDGADTQSVFTDRTIYHGKDKKKEENKTKKLLVFDLGGGTLDITILELEEDNISTISHYGDRHLGGEDFDNKIVDYCIKTFKMKTSIDLNDEEFLNKKIRLKEHCEKAKRILSFQNKVIIEIESIAKGRDFYLEITRAKFEELCKDIFEKCKTTIEGAFKPSKDSKIKINKNDIDEIVLVGGSTRIPKIEYILKEMFPGKEINKKLNPDEAVAHGATIKAAMELGVFAQDIVLLDVCPFSLGIAVADDIDNKKGAYLFSKVIKKGTNLPCKKIKNVIPGEDYQTSVKIRVYEGENDLVKYNYPLGNFILTNLPHKPKKEVSIEVSFEFREDSILKVSAVDKSNKSNSNSITIINDKAGLSENEIEKAKLELDEEKNGGNLGNVMSKEKNYKKEISDYLKKINSLTDENEQFLNLRLFEECIENFIDTFDKNNYFYKEKMHHYLTYLFCAYSYSLNFQSLISDEEEKMIVTKIINYLQIFAESGTSLCISLMNLFIDNDDAIFGEICLTVLQFYSQRATSYYTKNEKIISKYYTEEGLKIIKKYDLEKRIEDNENLIKLFKPIYNNINEFLNSYRADFIEKYCKISLRDILVKEENFLLLTLDEKMDILDMFKEASSFIKLPKTKEDKLLKAIYIANIVKIEYKILESNDYDSLLERIEKCIKLKLDAPEGCNSPELKWFKEICNIKQEIEEKQKNLKDNPDQDDELIKNEIQDIINKIDIEYGKGKTSFFFYILSNHKPNRLKDEYKFKNREELEKAYNNNKSGFTKYIRRVYHPSNYKGSKKEDRINRCIMRIISEKLNSYYDD